jgi:hypothetical protein
MNVRIYKYYKNPSPYNEKYVNISHSKCLLVLFERRIQAL